MTNFDGADALADLDRVIGAVRQRRRHPGAGLLDHADGLVVGEHHVLDGVDAGLERHALAGGREAMHRAGLVEGVRLVHHRVELFLRHVADVRLFLVGAAAAGGAGLDDVAAGQEVGARELAQFPRPVGGLEAEADGRARLDQRQMRAGDGGEAGDEHARAFQNAGIEGIADGAGFRHQQPALRVQAEIAQRGEAHVEAELGMEDAVHLLQLAG